MFKKMDTNCFKYNFAIVSRVPSAFKNESSFDLKDGETINIEKAREEQASMVEALRRLGVHVLELPCDEKHPDGLFVDDLAVVINGTALICNPPSIAGRPSRQGELAVIRHVLRRELGLKIVEVNSENAIVEGGDVLWTGREIFIGISKRTNMLGAQAVAKAFPEYPATIVNMHPPVTHLKDCVTMAGTEIMVVSKSEGAQKTFKQMRNSGTPGYKFISVEEDEAANVLYINNTLIHLHPEQIPKGAGVFENKIDYPRCALHMSEPLKRHGRLTGCVLLIRKDKFPKRIPTTLQ